MRRIVRKKLSDEAARYLEEQTQLIKAAPRNKRRSLARKIWKQAKRTAAFKEITRKLHRMATGLGRCMYCEDSSGASIDHFRPIDDDPRQAFRWKNYLYSCSSCNSNEKRSQFPTDPNTREPLLVKPTKDNPQDHLVLDPFTGDFAVCNGSAKGEPTIRIFGLNRRTDLAKGRRNAFAALQVLLGRYAELRRQGHDAKAAIVAETIREYPFSSVFAYLVNIAMSPAASQLIPQCVTAIRSCPEIRSWV